MSCFRLESSLGFSVTKKSNLDLIGDGQLMFIVGNTLQILNIDAPDNSYGKLNDHHLLIHGHADGIGAFAVHPSRECFAFGEIGQAPDIHIYSYPALQSKHKLPNGTQRRYSDMQFNVAGNYLATIGGAPDHMLTIWDWQLGSVILRAKAFSQEVFSVRFSPFNENRLITAGTGHIRFWEMAQTFTGLKLQGKIGKFGKVELSDIWSFVELPSGKILSGSEHGDVLMWHTDLIQFQAKPEGDADKTCHVGNVIYVDILKAAKSHEQLLISAGSDGFIRFWNCANIEFFEPGDDAPFFALELREEIRVATHSKLVSIIKHQLKYWLIQDAMGNLWRMSADEDHALESVMQFHGGFVSAIECAPSTHALVTAGKDGSVRRWDLRRQCCEFMKRLQSPVNLLLPLPADPRSFMAFCDDGVVRLLRVGADTFHIVYSLRVHDGAITRAAITNDGAYLATMSETQLFFSRIVGGDTDADTKLQPMGFVLIERALGDLYWSTDGRTLYSFCDTDVIAYTRPNPEQVDTSSSFEIELAPEVMSFVPFLTAADMDDVLNVDESKAADADMDEKETESDKKDSDDKKSEAAKVAEARVNVFDSVDWRISCILPCADNDTDLLIAIECADDAVVRIANFYQWNIASRAIVKFFATQCSPDQINGLRYSASKELLLASTRQSMLQIRDVRGGDDDETKVVNIRIHSSWEHTPNLMAMTFDDRLLFSASADGSLFCHAFDTNKLRHPTFDVSFDLDFVTDGGDAITAVSKMEQEYKKEEVPKDAPDMTQMDYSVQGEKIQRELDNAKSAAEAYKAELREQLSAIRVKKEEMLAQTKDFMQHDLGLSVSDLDIDKDLRSKMAAKLETDKKQLRREMAWNSEKIQIGLSKLERAFLKTVTVENIEVSSFRSKHSVSTFRTPLLPDWVQRDISKVHQIINAESEKARQMAGGTGKSGSQLTTLDDSSTFHLGRDRDAKGNTLGDTATTLTTNQMSSSSMLTTGTSVAKLKKDDSASDADRSGGGGAEASAEHCTASASAQKKMVREKLKSSLEQLQMEKPDENTDDPRDLEAIKMAALHIGDYKLKSASNYVVPEDEHVNASQKRKQMVLLLESVNYIKMGLNERVLALRDLKKRIVENVRNDTTRLNEINALLRSEHSTDEHSDVADIEPPTIDVLKEWPQERYTVKPEELREFEAVLEAEREAQSGSANAFGGGAAKTKKASSAAVSAMKAVAASELRKSESASYQKRLGAVVLSDLERKQLATRDKRLRYEKRVLLDKISSTITSFDAAVGELREEKYKLLNDLKLTELKLLTLLKELSVLSKFEEREIELNGKLLRCRTEKAQVVVDLTECQERLSSKLEEIHLWQEKDAKIMKEFDNIVGERNAFYDELKRIFKRKIKRHKRGKDGHGGASNESKDGDDLDSDSSLESSDDSDGGDSELDGAGGGGQKKGAEGHGSKKEDDSCPKDCDNLIYEKVMELREKRLDQEEILMEFEKAVDELKSQNVALISKEKQIDRSLAATEKEIELFQTEKQQFLNKIVITVPLLLSQMRIGDGDGDGGDKALTLPATIEHLLIFELKSLDRLQQRIVAQRHEKLAVKKEYVELKKLHKSLTKKINAKQSNIDVEKRKCEQVQFLKYGRLVSLEVLDLNNTSNAETLALKVKLDKLSAEYKHRHSACDKKLHSAKANLKTLIEQNTKEVEALSMLKARQNALKRELDKILDIDVIKDSAPSDQKRNRELQKLVEVAKTQANEIDVLKAEIHMLQRKGGMLYAVPEI